ncbi:hypothetical protein TorRG33x02_004640 [Trema orientale]|uniref:Uncharacterized protein n=1 Tax=Trema orientale TaxID=63057 RepID=A0A2P5G292_TREOI|nr:hypothetical protein TorRG33x02_004640 [Trema orientale]
MEINYMPHLGGKDHSLRSTRCGIKPYNYKKDGFYWRVPPKAPILRHRQDLGNPKRPRFEEGVQGSLGARSMIFNRRPMGKRFINEDVSGVTFNVFWCKISCSQFVVGYNIRGIEETEMKNPKDTACVSTGSNLVDRKSCFSIVAAAVKDVVPDLVVDVRSPELSVLIELLPLSRIPNGSLIVVVSVLPQNLVSTKPRLCVKALASNVKAKGAKH